MEWDSIKTALVTSIGGTGALLVVATFLGKKWVETRVKSSVEHEYAKKLLEHKAKLQEQVNESIERLKAKSSDDANQREIDIAQFNRFMDVLPSSGSIEFLRTFNMAGFLLNRTQLDQIIRFYDGWDAPEYHFLDNEIDSKRILLHKSSGEYLNYMEMNTFPSHSHVGCNYVPPEWEIEQPDRFWEVVNTLHKLAGKIVEDHEDLVKSARQKLKC